MYIYIERERDYDELIDSTLIPVSKFFAPKRRRERGLQDDGREGIVLFFTLKRERESISNAIFIISSYYRRSLHATIKTNMKHIDTDQLEALNSIQTPRKKTNSNHSKKPKGTIIAPGSTLSGVQKQNPFTRNSSSFGIPSIKSTQTKRMSGEPFKHNNSSRKKRTTQNTFLELASEKQRVDHYDPNHYYDDKHSWTYESSELADTQSNRKRRYGKQWNHDRTKRDHHSPHAKTSNQSYEWDDRKNYSLEQKHIEIDSHSEEEQEDGNHQKCNPSLHNGVGIGRDKNQHRVKEQDSDYEKVESIQKNTCHSNSYTVNEEDHQVYSLTGDSGDEKSLHEQQSSFSTAAIEQRLKGSKTASNMKSVVENIKDRTSNRGMKSRDEQIWTMRKVNNVGEYLFIFYFYYVVIHIYIGMMDSKHVIPPRILRFTIYTPH